MQNDNYRGGRVYSLTVRNNGKESRETQVKSSQVTNSHNTATATKKARVAAVYIAKKTSAALSKKHRSALLMIASIKPPDSPSAYGGRLG